MNRFRKSYKSKPAATVTTSTSEAAGACKWHALQTALDTLLISSVTLAMAEEAGDEALIEDVVLAAGLSFRVFERTYNDVVEALIAVQKAGRS